MIRKTEVADERAVLSYRRTLMGGALLAALMLAGCSGGGEEESSTDAGSETIQSNEASEDGVSTSTDESQDTDEPEDAEAQRSAGPSDGAADSDTEDNNPGDDNPGDGYVSSYTEDETSQLYAYVSGDLDLIGPTLANGTAVQMTDVAVVSGVLYGISFDELFLIDVETAEATRVAGFPCGRFNSLMALADGKLLAGGLDGSISIIDPETGSSDQLGSYPSDLRSSGDFVAMADGTVLGSANDGDDQNEPEGEFLVSIDPDTGATEVAVEDMPLNVWGLMLSADGELLGFTSVPADRCSVGEIIEIDIASGEFSSIGCTDFVPGGAANSSGSEDRR